MHQQKTTSIIFAIIFSLMVIGALLAIIKNQHEIRKLDTETFPSTSVKPTPTPKVTTITYTARGFQPATTTISKGGIVTFINKSNDSIWPVALGYPIIHSAFDAQKPIVTGQTYSYTFSNTTTLSYRNYLKPEQSGVIIVK